MFSRSIIIKPKIKREIKIRLNEIVYFENITNEILEKINYYWNNKLEITERIDNKYYNFDYKIIKSYNFNSNYILRIIDSAKEIYDYSHYDITNQLKKIFRY